MTARGKTPDDSRLRLALSRERRRLKPLTSPTEERKLDIKFNTTPCGFCKGTGIEPGEADCVWCENTGVDWAGNPGDIPVAIVPAVNPLRIALEHIHKTAGQSRTQTRRLRWIAKRAELALAGRPYVASEHELPPNGDSEHFKLLRQKAALKERVDLLEGFLHNAETVIDQFMPNVGKCFGIDFALLNETLVGIRSALKPAEVSGSTCNQIREETGLPINRPCKACNGGACIDR